MSEPRFKLGLYVYNRNEKGGPWWLTAQWALWPTVFGRYLSTIAKGWWKLGWGEINRHFEIGFAVGGEDNMLQIEMVLPFLARGSVGIRLPRALTKGWIYERRECSLKIGWVGSWLDVCFARDHAAADMRDYYRQRRRAGETLFWSRVALWPGISLSLHPRPIDWTLGRMRCSVDKGEALAVTVPMPEGNYSGLMTREERTWKRKRLPWASRRRTSFWIDMVNGIPVPGKGESSYDCEDGAVMGTGGSSPAEAIANCTKAALRRRERYGSKNWKPERVAA